ncbi:MAG: DNA mismatch repair protein MutS [Acidipila sp.]|nr:DNA mismatch repair protein MutS [Acidipila sp.]
MSENATPLMRQYNAIKSQHAEALLLFRLGDFYEMFYQDAVVAARALQITLTSRSSEQGQPVPMCGVPYHSAENYIARLLRAGHRVAICEQMEDPSKLKGRKLVRREVVRVITPGTATELQILEPKENNFLAALAWSTGEAASSQSNLSQAQGNARAATTGAGLAYLDVSTGEFRATEWTGSDTRQRAEDELAVLRPRELLLARPTTLFGDAQRLDLTGVDALETRLDDWVFREDYGERLLTERFGVATLEGFGLAGRPLAVAAAGALIHYLRETSAIGGAGLDHLDRVVYYGQPEALALDSVSVRNLELVSPAMGDEKGPTLLSTLDETSTPLGARLLRSWILRPAIEQSEIEARLDAVAELKSQTVAREELRGEMAGVLDLERLTSRVALGQVMPRELVALRRSLERIPLLRAHVQGLRSARIVELHAKLDELGDIRERIASAIAEDPPAMKAFGPSEAGMIRVGYSPELDELRGLGATSRQYIAAMEERERKRTGIGSLKIRYNQVFGYSIEISKPNVHLAPADFERKQTLVNAERYTTPELKDYETKVLESEERCMELETRLYREVREWIATQAGRLRATAAALAQLDVLSAFAHLAAARSYTRPEFNTSEMLLAGARHPVIEKLLEDRGERFVPNDLYLDSASHLILLITGPNMGGKSTYLRQAALIAIMAQMGSFVPAVQARLPLFDRIFTRIGASDNLARGRSTFLVEMSEVAAILSLATPRSLVLLDEVGRGTATFDGLSIAWAVVEHLQARTRARTLFATHYHELTELASLLPGVQNVHVAVKESGGGIVFLRRVEPGSADKSYGIEVARLAGLPPTVIERAREILSRHEQKEHKLSAELTPGAQADPRQNGGAGTVAPSAEQQVMFTAIDRQVIDALRTADLDSLRPIDALNLLAKLKDQIS